MFTGAHLHLVLNHWPIIVPMLGLLLLAFAWLRHSEPTGRTGLAFLIGGALAALPVYLTGEDAEEAVERAPGVTEALIERHEDAGLIAAVALGVLGVFALWALWRYRRPGALPRWVLTTALSGALVGSGLMAWVGLLGGQIRHTEVRTNPPAAFGTGTAAAGAPGASRGVDRD